jgi:hypothetical protein
MWSAATLDPAVAAFTCGLFYDAASGWGGGPRAGYSSDVSGAAASVE